MKPNRIRGTKEGKYREKEKKLKVYPSQKMNMLKRRELVSHT